MLIVDMVRCAGHGICSMVFPDRIGLDEWGFAHVDQTPLQAHKERKRAVRAIRACPRQALSLDIAPTVALRPTVES